ncbi:MAG TPA: isochorismatase family cysteine hydrolase, partial [Thermomicrobiales bacterium]|nr:isochorismatase family cysteine hydrolase [Thermomicrobiales bacterium]
MPSAVRSQAAPAAGALQNPFQHVLAPPPPLHISTANTALVVVDMQYFDAHPEWGEGRTAIELGVADRFDPYFAQIDDIMPRIQDLLARFRAKEMEVIHLRVAEVTADSRDVGWKQLVRGLVVPANSKEAEPLVEVAPVDDEIVVSKSSSGVFPVTNFDRLLRNMGITTLIMTGTSTGGCVESAVRDAVDLGYDVVVVADACACSTKPDHEQALARMEGGLTRIL